MAAENEWESKSENPAKGAQVWMRGRSGVRKNRVMLGLRVVVSVTQKVVDRLEIQEV